MIEAVLLPLVIVLAIPGLFLLGLWVMYPWLKWQDKKRQKAMSKK